MAAERNKARVLELIDRVTNGHDLTALEEFVGSARGLLQAFPDLRADVGRRDASWVVLADPEGNEFCILSGRVRPDSWEPVI